MVVGGWSWRPRLVIFDWDGTLSDSGDRIVTCFRRALAMIGAVAPLDDAVIRETIGLELPDAARVVMPDADAQRCEALTNAYRELWLAPGALRAQLFDDALPCLQSLRGAGLQLAVATGKSRRGLDRELAETGVAALFTATRTADETRGKPHPQMLHELLAHMQVEPEHALMVGDTTFDLEMAQAAGVRAVAITSGTHAPERLAALRPAACLAGVGELVPLVVG